MKEKTLDLVDSAEAAFMEIAATEEAAAMGMASETLEDGLESTNDAPGIPMLTTEPKTPLEHRREVIYILAANGMKAKAMAEELGVSLNTIYSVMNQPEASERVRFHQERLFGRNVRKRMDALANKAVDNLEKMLESPVEKVMSKATLYVLDQNVGKAKQTVEHTGSLISDLMDKIDKAREVQELAEIHQAPKDDLEILIDGLVPTHTVGVRNREK